MTLAVMGCVVNGPGESKHANIGISPAGHRRGAGRRRSTSTARRRVTLRGDNIADEFKQHRRATTWRAPTTERQLQVMSQTLQAVRGMNDILPDEAEFWERFEDTVRDWLSAYGYRPIRMPMVEPTPLFARAIGEVTDIVEKEMYSFADSLNGEQLTLRPEGTAGCVRAVLQHNLLYDGRSGSGTWGRCSATSGRRRAATASSIRSASRRSALPVRTSMPSRS